MILKAKFTRARLKRLRTAVVISLASVLPLSGCVSLLPKPQPAPTVYRLSIPPASKASAMNAITVNIEYPLAARALSGSDIVISPDGRRLSAAASANWSEPVPSLVRNILIDSLAQDGHIIGIIPKGSTRVPYRVNMGIRRFEAVFDQGEEVAPIAIVQFNLSLTETKRRKLVGSFSVKKEVRADAKRVSSIVNAQDEATQAAIVEIVDWLQMQLTDKNPS